MENNTYKLWTMDELEQIDQKELDQMEDEALGPMPEWPELRVMGSYECYYSTRQRKAGLHKKPLVNPPHPYFYLNDKKED